MDTKTFDHVMDAVVHGFEMGGVLILVLSSVKALVTAALSFRRIGSVRAYEGCVVTWGAASCWGWSS